MKQKYIELIKSQPDLWDHFTRKEEYNPEFRDQFNRFPYYLSKTRDIFQPDVSEFLTESGYKPEYPDGKKFAVCLTHDIDNVYRTIPGRGFNLAKSVYKKNKHEFSRTIKGGFNKRKPLCNFEEIMDLEEKYGAKSSFYFLALKPGDQDYSYDIMDLKNDIRNIRDQGWEVGLHGGHDAYNSYEKICEEKKRLEDALASEVVGYRNHYLRFCTPDTWEYLAQAGFLYDATFGYADCAGFRNGMCHPFRPYNLNTEEFIDIIEIPLVVMDGTLFQTYMRLDNDSALNFVKKLIDRVAELNGVFTLLWHNTYLVGNTHEVKIYEQILNYCSNQNGWLSDGNSISKWMSNTYV
ncbi:MAG: polysaccharide deacetylase family protein [Methanogenium sp.]|nr:polysaccharide deacetylase family protein [Methanogenium sp.]